MTNKTLVSFGNDLVHKLLQSVRVASLAKYTILFVSSPLNLTTLTTLWRQWISLLAPAWDSVFSTRLNPAHPVSFLAEEMRRCIVEGGMKGIKLWCAVKATDSRVDPIMEGAQNLGIPVPHHAWYKNADEYTWKESTPAGIANLARRFPDVTIIMAHLGGARHRGLLDLVDVPNVLVDTAGSQPESGLVEYGVRQLGAHRVIYGSDWPIRDYAVQLGRVLGARLRPEEYQLILRDNALRVLGLGETWA